MEKGEQEGAGKLEEMAPEDNAQQDCQLTLHTPRFLLKHPEATEKANTAPPYLKVCVMSLSF